MCHGISPGHLQRRTPPRLCDPPCSEKQAGIGPISQKPELVTMGLNYDDALDRTSFRQGAASSRLFCWLPRHGGVRPSSSGQRTIFLNGALFFQKYFLFFLESEHA
jgi:hypothetical protein